MGLPADTLSFLRKISRSKQQYSLPQIPALSYNGMLGNFDTFGIDYLNTALGSGTQDYLRIETDLISRYIDYEDMDESPIISSAYDIFADDSTQPDTMHDKTMWIESDDEYIRHELDENLLQKTLNIDDYIWEQARSLVKYGNDYSELVVKEGAGVIGMNFIPAPTIRRIEIPRENITLGYIYDPRGVFKITTNEFLGELENRSRSTVNGQAQPTSAHRYQDPYSRVFEDWEIVHMRLRGKSRGSIYGYGVSEAARWIFKRLSLLEDTVIVHRITRAPGRYAFYIDVSNIPPNETMNYLTKVKNGLKKSKFVNPSTGKLDLRYNMVSSDEDYFLTTRDGKENTRIETLNSPVYDHIEDIKYFENKLFAALKVPKPFLTYEETTAKTHLSAEDARFARTILRIQREIKSNYKRVCQTHLAAKKIDIEKTDFKVRMSIPSAIFELAQLEIRNAEIELADKFQAWAPRYWIMQEILGFSDDQIHEMEQMRKREEDGEIGPAPSGGGGSGSLERALEKRGTSALPKAAEPERPAPTPATGAESRNPKISSDQYLLRGIKKNTDFLTEKIAELRKIDPSFNHKLARIESMVSDLKSAMT